MHNIVIYIAVPSKFRVAPAGTINLVIDLGILFSEISDIFSKMDPDVISDFNRKMENLRLTEKNEKENSQDYINFMCS